MPALPSLSFLSLSARRRGLLPLAGLLLVAARPLAAQTRPDSTAVRYEEETVAAPTPPAPAARPAGAQVQERRLLKLGLNNVLLLPDNVSRDVTTVPGGVRYERYGLHLAAEQKLGAAWTVLAELSPYLMRYAPAGLGGEWGLCCRAQVAGRYYYNLGRRLRLGKSAGNFAGNYLSVAVGSGFGRQAHETAFLFFRQAQDAPRFDAALLYGLQRRLGSAGFVDFSVGLPLALSAGATTRADYFTFSGPALAVNLRLGLCLGR